MRQKAFAALFFALVFVAAAVATAQEAAQAPVTATMNPSQPLPERVPDWLVWRVFHDSLLFYHQQSPSVVGNLVEKRANIAEGAELDQFLTIGRNYLDDLSRIEAEARETVRTRYQSSVTPLHPSQELLSRTSRHPGVNAVPPPGLISGRLNDGRKLYDALMADGLIAEVDHRRQATLETHLQALNLAVGPERLEKLTDWVRADVAPNVVVGGPPGDVPSSIIQTPPVR